MPSLRAVCFVPALVLVTLLCGAAAIVAGALDPHRRWALHIVPLWSRVLLRLGGVEVELSGETGRVGEGSAVFAANHQSYLDIPVLSSFLPDRSLWLAKRELFQIPVFGRAMRAVGQIPVDRGNREAARASIEAAAEEVARGFSATIFPEGTRGVDGSLGLFKLGFAHLASLGRVPVVPLVVRGTADLWPKGAWGTRPGKIEVVVLPPMTPPDVPGSEALRGFASEVRQVMLMAGAGR